MSCDQCVVKIKIDVWLHSVPCFLLEFSFIKNEIKLPFMRYTF